MRVNTTRRDRMEPVLLSDTRSRNDSGAVVVVRQPGGEYMLGGDPQAFRFMNNPAFYLGIEDFRADPIVRISNLPAGSPFSDDHNPNWRFSASSEEPQTRRRPQSAPFDVEDYVSRHVDVLQFLPSERPVSLFTLFDCTNRLAALSGSVQNGVVGYGTRQIRRARDFLTGRNGIPGSGNRVVTEAQVATDEKADVAAAASVRNAERNSQIEPPDWRARKLRFSATLDTRAHWSFAMYELRAEAEQRRKERRWRDIAALAQVATGQAAAAAKVIVEVALRRLTEASSQGDVATVITGLQNELAVVQDWLTTERAFTGEYARAAVSSASSPAPTSATGVQGGTNTAPNEYARLLEKHPGARRFLRRVPARRAIGTNPVHVSDRGERLPQITEIDNA